MSKLNSQPDERFIEKIRGTLNELIKVKKLKQSKIAYYLGLEKQQHSAFYKYIKGGPLPKYLEPAMGKILEQLNKLMADPGLLKTNPTGTQDDVKGYDMSKPFLVWIPFDQKLPITDDYNITMPPLSIIQMGKQKGIVAYRNTSKYNAEGEIFVGQTGMATDIEPATRIAIKRINKTDWKADRYYVIVDASEEISICELLPGDDEKTIRFVSTKSPEGPHKVFPFERILAIFKIVDGNYIPTPKRNSAIASIAQQPNPFAVNPPVP
jgi:hypothetical protein